MNDKGNWTGTERNMRRFKKVVNYMVSAAVLANYKNLPFLREIKPHLYCRDEKGLWIVNSLYELWEEKLQTVAFEIQTITKELLLKKETQKNKENNVQQKTVSLTSTLYAVDSRITALDKIQPQNKITPNRESSNNKSSTKKSPVKNINPIIYQLDQSGKKRKAELNAEELVGDKGKKIKSAIDAKGNSNSAVKNKGNKVKTMNNYFTSSKTSSSSD
mmetsp:Transcript_2020/g.2133  ORF Transcript_2020/g.2133 Transcript_2020/m.2133 type:complete len:217 (+) Transcript_2020:617-1267(+)